MAQAELFKEPQQFKNCIRCAKRCRVEGNKDPNASIFVKGDMKTGKFCAECLIVDFFKNFAIGPSSALGKEYFDHALPQPEWRKEVGDKDKRFDPASLREPHVQEHMLAIIQTAARVHGAQLTFEEIDWDEVIANWHLPFPEKPKGRGKRKRGTP